MTSNPSAPVRVGIVDDSRSIRRWLQLVIQSDPRLQVAGEAGNALEARDMLQQSRIDVMTLDVDMPQVSGLQFLSRLMERRPMPVVMVSALTERGSREAIEALSLGAIDCIEKPRSGFSEEAAQDICERVWQASQIRVSARQPAARTAVDQPSSGAKSAPWNGDIILLGSSTGGVSALEDILAELDGLPQPVVIAQHMPEKFLRSFARRLDEHFSRNFVVASDGHELKSHQAVLCLGKTFSTRLQRRAGGQAVCVFGEPSRDARYRPCVDDLFNSCAEVGMTGHAALLTGMGADGAKGLLALKGAGFNTYAQTEASCVVFGMPKAAIELGAADKVLDPSQIGQHIAQNASSSAEPRRQAALR